MYCVTLFVLLFLALEFNTIAVHGRIKKMKKLRGVKWSPTTRIRHEKDRKCDARKRSVWLDKK